MEKLPISVIIIARNASETVQDCLETVRKNNPAEIVLVDGNSTDGTVEIARKYTDKIFSDVGKGKTFARQIGAEKASQEYIAYVDSDITLPDGTLSTMLQEFKTSKGISMSAEMLIGEKYRNYWGMAAWEHNHYSLLRRNMEYLGTAGCLLKRETILKYKFDTTPGGYLDDMLLEAKLRESGHKLGSSHTAVYHNHRTDFRTFVKYRFFLGGLTPSLMKKQGPWHAGLWPPVYTAYWLAFSVVKLKPKLIPYFVVNGCAQTAGMVKRAIQLLKSPKG